jgi:hypothetical protein
VAFVDVSVDVSASVSFKSVDGVSEVGGVMGMAIEWDSWMMPSAVGGGMSVDTSTICSSYMNHQHEIFFLNVHKRVYTHIVEGFSTSDSDTLYAADMLDCDLPLQRSRQLGGLFHLPLFRLRPPPCQPLLAGLPGHTSGTGARADSEALVCQPSLQDTTDNIECAGLDHPAPDVLTSAYADVDHALEG